MVMDMREINKIIVHCADTPEGRDVKTEEIKRWHTEERGWSDIGYHWVVELDGSIHAGRDESINGAHCRGHNSDSIGICYVGGADSEGNPKRHTNPRTEGFSCHTYHRDTWKTSRGTGLRTQRLFRKSLPIIRCKDRIRRAIRSKLCYHFCLDWGVLH